MDVSRDTAGALGDTTSVPRVAMDDPGVAMGVLVG